MAQIQVSEVDNNVAVHINIVGEKNMSFWNVSD